jgi:hypothetical protein
LCAWPDRNGRIGMVILHVPLANPKQNQGHMAAWRTAVR